MGINLCRRLLRNRCWFPNLDMLIQSEVGNCLACQANSDTTKIEPLIPTNLPIKRWFNVSIDYSSRTPSGEYILVIICEGTRYPVLNLSKDLTSESAIKILKTVFKKYGIPAHVKSDNGPAFKSEEFREFAEQMNFHHVKVTPYWPRANGVSESFMRNINKTIRCSIVYKSKWKETLNNFTENYKNTPNSSTGITPNLLMLGKDLCPLPSVRNIPSENEMFEQANMRNANSKYA